MKSHSLCGRLDWAHNYWSCKLWTFDLNNAHEYVIQCAYNIQNIYIHGYYTVVDTQRRKLLSHDARSMHTAHTASLLIRFLLLAFILNGASSFLCSILNFPFLFRHFDNTLYNLQFKNENDDTQIEFSSFHWKFSMRKLFVGWYLLRTFISVHEIS